VTGGPLATVSSAEPLGVLLALVIAVAASSATIYALHARPAPALGS